MPRTSHAIHARLLYAAALLSLAACAAGEDPASQVDALAGGDTTAFNRTSNAYTFPAPNLDDEALEQHLEGDVAFEANFVTPPATLNSGLGPVFNNSACVRCHVRDGRGLPAAGLGPLASPLLVRISAAEGEPSVPGGAIEVPGLGTQLQDHAVYGVEPEATISVEWIEVSGQYADGEPYSLRRPRLSITLADGSPLPGSIATSPRIPPPVFGLGLLEAIPEQDLIALADPEDLDDDGISGRANHVWQVETAQAQLGRFGWKSNTPDLRQQAAAAYANDMGVSNSLFPEEDGTHELDDTTLDAATFYTRTLAVPARTTVDAAQERRGEALFEELGCSGCHVPTWTTGEHEVEAVAHQQIHPYTDLLLHNMGFELADGRDDFMASGTEWRTPPLWGIGLTQTVLPYACFLHDGRARTLQEAILWHAGEAEAAKESFRMLPKTERDALLAFLGSL